MDRERWFKAYLLSGDFFFFFLGEWVNSRKGTRQKKQEEYAEEQNRIYTSGIKRRPRHSDREKTSDIPLPPFGALKFPPYLTTHCKTD